MDKVQKPGNVECYTSLSEPFRIFQFPARFSQQASTADKFAAKVDIKFALDKMKNVQEHCPRTT
jgi:hypothetical protein